MIVTTGQGLVASEADGGPARWVDPFIGTGGHGHTFPGATLPFGMVQLSPDTRLEGWDGCSGYHYSDTVVYGFSHTHLSGTGVPDYTDILLMPVAGEPHLSNGAASGPDSGYASRFSKQLEFAEPGWYAVHLDDYDIDVELTATLRTGMHRYRFPAGRPGSVIIDLSHRDEVLDSAIQIVGVDEVAGFRRSRSWADDQIIFFVARFSRPFEAALAGDGQVRVGATELTGHSVKGVLGFGDAGGELLIKVGISAVDLDGARRNLEAELPGWDFDGTRAAARRTWNEALDAIEVEGGSDRQRRVFYTALYHSLLAPNTFSDADGRYRGMDGAVHRAVGRRHYTVFSLWDTFRATHPLLTILQPERTREFIETFLAQYREGGRLPVWELAGNETDTMIGYHAVSVIADAHLKGIGGFDTALALEAMVHSASTDLFGLDVYRRHGFLGADDEAESVSKTLEYAYDDWCISEMAASLGRDDLAREFRRRSQGWRHLLDPETGLMRARVNQRWIEAFDPRRVDVNYTEANAWQYSFFVPHDVEGLIEASGGEAAFDQRLDALFAADSRTTGRHQVDITGLIGQYAHGNEPSHHVAWLSHFTGRPEKTHDRVRRILKTMYRDAPDGLAGNEDCGQMSSWYVLSTMGLYPPCPGRPEYLLGVPAFPRMVLHLPDGREFVIRSHGDNASGYVRAVTLNGRPLNRSFLRHDELIAGGVLELTLGPTPSPSWGRAAGDRPLSRVEGPRVVAAPFAVAGADLFRDQLTVDLRTAEPGAVVHWTRAEAPDEQAAEPWEGPLVISHTTGLRFRSQSPLGSSPQVSAHFHRVPVPWRVTVVNPPNPQYTGGGADILIDGRRGPPDWRLGGWQGFQYGDFEAVVDLVEPRPLHRVGGSFIQDVEPWIWMPTEVVIAVSDDGEIFREVGRVRSTVDPRERGAVRRDLVADLGTVDARFVRVVARNFGTIPEWHPGHGDGAFIFIDEILIE